MGRSDVRTATEQARGKSEQIMRLQTLITIIALIALGCFLAMVTLDWLEGRPEEAGSTHTTKSPPRTKADKPTSRRTRTPGLRDVLIVAERAQKLTKWEAAARQYREGQKTLSLSEKDADTVRRKLDAVKDVILAEKLVAEEKWDEAILHYQAALDEIENRSHVEREITNTGIQKNIAKHKAKAQQLAKERKWDEARAVLKEALRIARGAGVPTDIRAEMRRLEKVASGIGDRVEQMNRAIDAGLSKDNLYGVFALCYGFERDPDYASEQKTVEARKAHAADAIAARPQHFPSPAAVADTEVVTVQREAGATIQGALLQTDGPKLTLHIMNGPRLIRRTVVRGPEEKIEKRTVPAEDLNESRAKYLLTEAAQAIDRKDRMKALTLLGCLVYYFPKSKVVTDKTRQDWLIGAASARVAAAYGRTLEQLICHVAEDLADMCTRCSGTGRVMCPVCNGTGMRSVKCMMCQGTGSVPCFRCGGTKRALVNGKMITCPSCKGTGKSTCAPCRGEGKLSQGCNACDVDHMVKCPECGGAGRGQRRVEDLVVGPEALVKADTPKQRKRRMEWVFDICTSKQDYYALLAAARHYEGLEKYKKFADTIAARKREAESGIKEQIESAKANPERPKKHDKITTKDKKVLVGKIAGETDSAITIAVHQGGKTIKRIVLRKSISKLEKDVADEEGSVYAVDLLADAAVFMRENRPGKDRQALACIGKLLFEHPDSEVAANEEIQKHTISNASAETAMTIGNTLPSLLSAAVRRMETICFDCLGKGKFPCEVCKGSGIARVPCKWCHGAKRIFCRHCGGSGREGDTEHAERPCSKCNGTGWTDCPHCRKTGTQVARCRACNGAGEVTCKTCGGDGRVDNQPKNP